MKFDRLKIVGFKTFVDPAEFLIEPGLTGIVGPNGCGKSNLVEALRWVMGETSHKSMRGAGMDDVIFGGSGSRPSRNTAEVVLRVDNSARDAPAAFNDAEVLEISRRIEREEGSTYRVNGREVRARDVQLLFADAASGARSPSLVRQGQIGEIIAAKPQARRRILEDAAGIAGLHSRRHEAELRLKAADDNLLRVEDVLTHLDAQIEGLARQAKQAGRYRVVAAQIRRAEALLHHIVIIEAQAQRDAAARQLDLDTRLVAERSVEQGETVRQQAIAEHELEPLGLEEAKAGAALQRLMLARDGLDAEETRTRSRIAELDRRLRELASDLDRDRQRASDADLAIARLTAEGASLVGDDDALPHLPEAQERSAIVESKLQTAELSLAALQSALADRHARLEAATRAADDASLRLERSNRQYDAAEAELVQLRGQSTDHDTRFDALRQKLAAAERAVETSDAAAHSAEESSRLARDVEGALRPPLAEAERAAQRLETEAATIRKLLSGEATDLWPPIVEKVTVAKGYEIALGAALGEDLAASIEVTAPVHWRGVGAETAADSPGSLPTGAEPIASHVSAPSVLGPRLAAIGVVEKTQGGSLQALLKPGQRLVSREGDLWRWDGYHAAAEAPTSAAKRLAEKNRLGEVETAAADAVAHRDRLRHEAEAAIITARSATNAETAARTDLKAARAAADAARSESSGAERRYAEFIARRAALEETVLRLTQQRDEAAEASRLATALLEETGALSRQAIAAGDADQARSQVLLLRAEAAEARAAMQALQREAEFRVKRRIAIDSELLDWARRTERASLDGAELRGRIESVRSERAELDATPAEIAGRRRAILTGIDEAELVRKDAADRKAEAETRFAAADRAARQALAELATSREARAASQARLDAAVLRYDEIARAGSTASEADAAALAELVAAGAGRPAAAIESELGELKRERERIGSVNLQADEELLQVTERRDRLILERDDLAEAIRRLRRGIETLNAEGRERLKAAFQTVNAHFKRLFAILFGGGEADLVLIESDDPLEAGLEIIARPPGKKPQVLTLLSGGEQALTASALIFAVFLTSPAPICVLDEIDAPLDDANVERICDLLDTMARETSTRFITITHNPITMARMDRLFGVTMAERGVSQLVSVDLTQAEALTQSA